MTRAEAADAVARFLDDAQLAGVNEVTILHGKGSGSLRQLLWTKLRQDQRVAKIRHGEPAEGGMGVTLVTLRGNG